jgi:hypothetical protein
MFEGMQMGFDVKDDYIPLRLVSESLEYKVDWNQSSMSVSIGR